jgi:hypothetical protein
VRAARPAGLTRRNARPIRPTAAIDAPFPSRPFVPRKGGQYMSPGTAPLLPTPPLAAVDTMETASTRTSSERKPAEATRGWCEPGGTVRSRNHLRAPGRTGISPQ